MPEPDISQFDDRAVARELSAMAADLAKLLSTAKSVHKLVDMASKFANIDAEFEDLAQVSGLIESAKVLSPGPDGKTDMIMAQRYLLAATLRMSVGVLKAIDRTTNPRSDEDPDNPVVV